jgi:hypothetical protein
MIIIIIINYLFFNILIIIYLIKYIKIIIFIVTIGLLL